MCDSPCSGLQRRVHDDDIRIGLLTHKGSQLGHFDNSCIISQLLEGLALESPHNHHELFGYEGLTEDLLQVCGQLCEGHKTA